MEYGDALKEKGEASHRMRLLSSLEDVHSEMIAAGADSDTAVWRIVEARLCVRGCEKDALVAVDVSGAGLHPGSLLLREPRGCKRC